MTICDFCKSMEKHRRAHTYSLALTNLDVDEEDKVSGIDYCYDLCSICVKELAAVIDKAIPEEGED